MVPHDHQRVKLVGNFDGHTDHNQNARRTESRQHGDVQHLQEQSGDDCNNHQEECAEHCQAAALLLEVVRSGTTGTNTGNKSAVLLEIFGNLNRVEGDGGVEVSEAHDHDGIKHIVNDYAGDIRGCRAEVSAYKGIEPALGPELTDHAGNLKNRHSEDQGHNAVCIRLERDMRGLSAVEFPADNALCVLNGNAANRLFNGNDTNGEDKNHKDNHDSVPPLVRKTVSGRNNVESTVDKVDNNIGNGGNNGCKDQN